MIPAAETDNELLTEVKDRGGMVDGKAHSKGGETFAVAPGHNVELEGEEAVITAAAMDDKKFHAFRGTNLQILNQINQLHGGKPMSENVTSVSAGDIVICKASVHDKTRRTIHGTCAMALDIINRSQGCNHIADTGKSMQQGGTVFSMTDKLSSFYSILSGTVEQRTSVLSDQEINFVNDVLSDLKTGRKLNKISLEKKAAEYGIRIQNLVKELTELAIVTRAREIVQQYGSGAFDYIVSLYELQPNLSHRTSDSVINQQYSTPAPIAYLMGIYTGINSQLPTPNSQLFFEPSAGNGMLTIAGKPENFIVNEIDDVRKRNLLYQHFGKVLSQDATEPFTEYFNYFDAVLTNPPFGSLDAPVSFGPYEITSLEHLMALRALETMKDTGKAAIIIGGHNRYDDEGRLQKGKNRTFFSYVAAHYNLEDVINVDGDLYSRMGTSFDIRVILINGRKQTPGGFYPLLDETAEAVEQFSGKPVSSFEMLYDRIIR